MKSSLGQWLTQCDELAMLDEPQLGFLWYLAMWAPDGAAVECGVYQGGSLFAWERGRQGRGPVYAVDNWPHPKWRKAKEVFEQEVAARNLSVVVIDAPAYAAVRQVPEPVAFCFIDADHGIAGIPADIVAWAPTIMPGGILAFHDYGVSHRKPTNVVQPIVDAWQATAQWEDVGLVGSVKAFRRPYEVDYDDDLG